MAFRSSSTDPSPKSWARASRPSLPLSPEAGVLVAPAEEAVAGRAREAAAASCLFNAAGEGCRIVSGDLGRICSSLTGGSGLRPPGVGSPSPGDASRLLGRSWGPSADPGGAVPGPGVWVVPLANPRISCQMSDGISPSEPPASAVPLGLGRTSGSALGRVSGCWAGC